MNSRGFKCFMLASALFFYFTCRAEEAQERPLRVGMIFALSAGGIFRVVSLEMKTGIEMALTESGSYPMEIVYEDDGGAVPRDAVTAARKLLDQHKVDVLLNWGYSTQPVIAPLCNRAKTPCIVIWDSNQEARTLGDYNFSIGVATEASAANMADFSYRNRSRRRIAVIAASDHWSELMRKSFEARFKELGGKIVLSEVVKPDTTDLRSLLVRVKQTNADSLFLPLYATTMHAAIRQARQLQVADELFTGDSVFESDLKELGAVSNGVFSSQLWISDPAFHALYEKHSQKQTSPVSAMQAALAYDAIRFLSHVTHTIRKNSAVTPTALRDGIAGIAFSGLTGPIGVREALQKVETAVVAHDGEFRLVAQAFQP